MTKNYKKGEMGEVFMTDDDNIGIPRILTKGSTMAGLGPLVPDLTVSLKHTNVFSHSQPRTHLITKFYSKLTFPPINEAHKTSHSICKFLVSPSNKSLLKIVFYYFGSIFIHSSSCFAAVGAPLKRTTLLPSQILREANKDTNK
jgi:hypothetical protein